jgi:3-hydroxyisobutyrate dehydrogenase-like beta-hydroxyacid dehydrogenase
MNQQREQVVSFVGLGKRGLPLARHLFQALLGETSVCVFDQQKDRMELLHAQGALVADDLGSVTKPGGIVFTMLPDDRSLLQVSLGEGGLLKQLGPGGIHVSLSSTSPHVATQLDKLYKKQHCTYLSASVLGSPDMAEKRETSIFLAGDPTAKKRVRPLLITMGKYLYDLGKQMELATIAQVASMVLVASLIESLGEMATLVEAYGMNRQQFFHVLAASSLFGGVAFEDSRRRIEQRSFGDACLSVSSGLKEVELAIQLGQEKELDFPGADTAYEHLLAALDAGRGDEDWSVLSDFARPEALCDLF